MCGLCTVCLENRCLDICVMSLLGGKSGNAASSGEMEDKKRVCIVGAGVSGLVACKYLNLLEDWEASVVEGKGGIGGVWSGEAAYNSTRLQTSKEQYEFSDWAWNVADAHPTHGQVREYLGSYARRFGLMQHIRLSCAVVGVVRLPGEDGWDVVLADGGRLRCHFVVLCCGLFGDLPRIPASLGSPDRFQGTLLHALDYSRLDAQGVSSLVAGRRVLLLGFQKTSIDIALEVAQANPGLGCTMLFRRTHWLCPSHKRVLGVPLGLLFSTRFAQYWVRQPYQGALQGLLQALLSPLRCLVFKVAELGLLLHYPADQPALIPEHPLVEDLAGCILPQLPPAFFPSLKKATIRLQKCPSWTFSAKGVTLADRTQLEADVIIMCTGYDGMGKLRKLLPPPYRQLLTCSSGLLPLYRGLIHPAIPDMAFLGYQEGLSSIHSSELGARWLAHYLSGKLTLPSRPAMQRDISRWMACVTAATRFVSRVCISLLHIAHADKLCQDMGWQPRRKRGFLADCFAPYSNSDYKTLTSLDTPWGPKTN